MIGWTPLGQLGGYTPRGGIAETIEQSLGGRPGANVLPSGRFIEPTYDDGLLTTLTTIEYHYDPLSGQLASAITSDGMVLSFGYDGDMPTSASFTWPGTPEIKTLSFDYDAVFNLASEHINSAPVATYAYDLDGLMTQAGPEILTRDPEDGTLSNVALHVLNTNYTYDDFNRPMRRWTRAGTWSLFDEQLDGRDENGRITGRSETVGGDFPQGYAYEYDDHDRLSYVRKEGRTWHTYSYDPNGNRKTATDWGEMLDPTCNCSGGEGAAWSIVATHDADYDTQDRIIALHHTRRSLSESLTIIEETTTRSFTYDADGFIDTWTDEDTAATTDLDYDAMGSLRRVTLPSGQVITYEIDGMQRRVGRRVDGELTARWIYRDPLHPAAELDEDGDVVALFVYAEEANVPSYIVKNGVTYRVISDHLGSVRLVVEAMTGNVVQRIDYDDFGQVLSDTNPGFQPFGFAGGLYDPATGLVRFGARDYDAVTGRWTARDPALFKGGQANLYEYVGSDPVNQTDPTGLWILQAAGGPFGAGAQAYTNYDAFACGQISGMEYAASIGVGLAVGVVSTLPGGIGGGALAGGLGSGFNEAFNVGIGAKDASLSDFIQSVGLGAIAGGAANALGKAGGQLLKAEEVIGQSLPLGPLQTYGELGGAIGTAVGTVGTTLFGGSESE